MQALLDAIAAAPLPTEACRIFHGRGGLHPGCEGWTLDAYPPVWVFTSFEPADDALLAAVHQALQARWATLAPGAALHWVYQCRHPQQRETRTMAGQVPEPHVVQEDGARYLVHVLRGQNHRLNSVEVGALFWDHDIFSSWGKITRHGPYGLVIIDPPSYQKGSFVATKDYARLLRRLPDLLAPGGHALLCLNAPELDSAFLRQQVQEQAPTLQFVERVANPAAFADAQPERALKVLVYREAGRADLGSGGSSDRPQDEEARPVRRAPTPMAP